VSTHVPPHSSAFRPRQTHAPPAQLSPAAQGMPQPPQWSGSVSVSVQIETPSFAHTVLGAAQAETQVPASQSSPSPHSCSHVPQWLASTAVSTHAPRQRSVPDGQVAG
jgi:hypothetical protein